jgi:hypothetical protein
LRKHLTPGVVLGVVAIFIALSGSAVASSLITSAKIKDGTIQARDIKKGSISIDRLSSSARKALLTAGPAGPAGAKGEKGEQGDRGPSVLGSAPVQGAKGDKGDAGPTLSSGYWGLVNRNTIGSSTAFLRSGPATPPVGKGALNLTVGNGTEKVAYGNEVDSMAGGLVKNLSQVGFYVYTTGENISAGGAAANMPSITFEIDPNVAAVASDYSSLVFMPDNSPANKWSDYIDATKTGHWGLTGGKFAGTKCDINGTRCSFAEVMDYLNDGGDDATILTVGIVKGRDFAWSGAVDGLRINSTIFDFEETGVFTRTAS